MDVEKIETDNFRMDKMYFCVENVHAEFVKGEILNEENLYNFLYNFNFFLFYLILIFSFVSYFFIFILL